MTEKMAAANRAEAMRVILARPEVSRNRRDARLVQQPFLQRSMMALCRRSRRPAGNS